MDRVIHKLETFTEPTFNHLQHTARVVVVGSWYSEYTELETQAGLENVLSPAVRMFSTLIDVCLFKMSNLDTFMWASLGLWCFQFHLLTLLLADGMLKSHQHNDWSPGLRNSHL